MSNKELARRAVAEVCFDGVDISAAVEKYLISLTYTDNEEDEADDLQIRLEDRDGIWLTKWLNAAVHAAASAPGTAQQADTKQYKVTAEVSVWVRSGPGTSYSQLGYLTHGAVIEVSAVENGWASTKYSGHDAYVSAMYLQEVGGGEAQAASDSAATDTKGLRIQAVIIRQNWQSDGKDKVLDFGQFELDSVTASGPPSEVTIKCTSLPYHTQIRQTKKSKAWENYSLSGIAREMATANGMACLYESNADPFYDRLEQVTESDISFLSGLCHDAGVSLKATSNILVLFDQAAFEIKDAVRTITKGGGSYIKYKLSTGAADARYASCRVSYTSPDTGAVISATAYSEDYQEGAQDNQCLEITAKVNSVGEAQALAEKSLRLKNKYEYGANFTLPGDPDLVAGVTVNLSGWGPWDGKYIVKQAKHTINSSGYTTQITLRRALARANDTQEPARAPAAWAVGDTVIATGRPQYSSYGEGTPGKSVTGYRASITRLNLKDGIPYPIHVGAIGWFAESQVEKEA